MLLVDRRERSSKRDGNKSRGMVEFSADSWRCLLRKVSIVLFKI